MIVYGSSISPFVRKVLVICGEKGLEVERVITGPGMPPPDDFVAASPFKKIPAIKDGDYLLSDSTAIATYLEAKHPTPPLLPDSAEGKGKAIWFDEFADTIVFGAGQPIFWNRVVQRLMGKEGDQVAADEAAKTQLPPAMDYLETVAPEDGWLLGQQFTLADIAVGSVFVNMDYAGEGATADKHPRLAAYLARVHARPSFGMIEKDRRFIDTALKRAA